MERLSSISLFLGLLATAIIKMEGVGGLAGWRWIFILEGLATIVAGIIATVFLPTDIQSARFLTAEEKVFACICPDFPIPASPNAFFVSATLPKG